MLHISTKRLLFCIVLLLCISRGRPVEVVDQQDDHDDDHDHDHDHGHEDSFTHLTEQLGTEGFVNETSYVTLTSKLQERFTCESECVHCMSLENITLLANLTRPFHLDEDEFTRTAEILFDILISGNCVGINSDSAASFNLTTEAGIGLMLASLKPKYEEEHDTKKCFNAHTLAEITADERVFQLHANFFEGHCVYPTTDELQESYFDHFGVETQDVPNSAYLEMLSDLGIGKMANGTTTEPETGHEGHDHKRRRRDLDHVIVKREEDHDHDHDHDSDHGEETMCYSGAQLKELYGLEGNLTRDQVMQMCPGFLQQIVSGSCKSPAANTSTPVTSNSTYTNAQRYGYGTASVALISLLAFVGILFFPVLSSVGFKLVMQFFIALGVGTLSGDSILHIIPEIVGLHKHEAGAAHDHEKEDNSYVWKLLVVVAGIWLLFIFENAIKVFVHSRKKRQGLKNESMNSTEERVTKFSELNENEDNAKNNKELAVAKVENGGVDHKQEEDTHVHHDHHVIDWGGDKDHKICFGLNTVCIMVLFGDMLHNFGDGIAIGAAFSASWVQGIGTSLAIFCHELPHEFGDFAIYMRNDLTKWKALLLNFLAACCAFIGLYIGIALSSDSDVRTWLLAIVAGMFIYIAFVNVLHEMVGDYSNFPVLQFFLQNLGMVLGWAIMLVLSLYEDQLVASIRG